MSLLEKYPLFDEMDKEVATVIPYKKTGTFRVYGHRDSILRHINKEIDGSELQQFKELHNLRTTEELGQLTLEEVLGWR